VERQRSDYNKPAVITDNQKEVGSSEEVPVGGGGSFTGRAPRLVVARVSKTRVNAEQNSLRMVGLPELPLCWSVPEVPNSILKAGARQRSNASATFP